MRWIAGLIAAMALVGGAALPGRASAAANPIVVENAQPGTPGWDQGVSAPMYGGLDGYTSEVSVTPGQPVHLHVTAPAGVRYRIEVYRLGWYAGVGARLVECLPSCTTDEVATLTPPLPAPAPQTGFLDAGWPVTDGFTVGSSWVSGYYVAKLKETAGNVIGQMRVVPFFVREATPRSGILVQAGVNTAEAYNNWGGKSLYAYNSVAGVAAVKVSFNRPNPTNWPLWWDYQLVRFLERNGYDVSYATDVDTAAGADAPGARRLVIVAGHGEYWSKEIRDALDAAQATGTNMAFLGANTGYWQMRYADSYRSIYEYRGSMQDPEYNQPDQTTRFRQLTAPRPECLLEGVQYGGISQSPLQRSYTVVPGALSNTWFTGSGFTQSSVIAGAVGYEWDNAGQPGCPLVQRLFTWSGMDRYGSPNQADAATFTAASGARVFAAGTLQYSWGLDGYGNPGTVDPYLQAFTRNVLDDLSGTPPGTPPPMSTSPPVILGLQAVEGQTLSVSNGTWAGNPTSFTYQWRDCDATGNNCSSIAGATGSTYTLSAADVRHTLSVVVTASNAGGSTLATSDETGTVIVLAAITPPRLSGLGLRPSSFLATIRTTLTLMLSEPATITVVITKQRAGRRVKRRCRMNAKKGKRCTLTVQQAQLRFTGVKGRNHLRFRIPSLAPGHYNLMLSALDSGGRKSKPGTLTFTIKKAKKTKHK